MPGAAQIVVLMPVFDDWESVVRLLGPLDAGLAAHGMRADVVLVDDGSLEAPPKELGMGNYRALGTLRRLRLRRNLGHQRAIAVGLVYVNGSMPCEAVVVMDSDGEDRPEDVPKLVAEFRRRDGREIVFAERRKRSERMLFVCLYHVYRLLHWVLVGIPVKVGNFSIIPFDRLGTLAVTSEMWSHYAAAVFKAKVPRASIPLERGVRLAGQSKMRFTSLVAHGLSAIWVFGEVVGVRLAAASAMVAMVAVAATAAFAAGAPETAGGAGWIVYGCLAAVLLESVVITLMFAFLTIGSRNDIHFLPLLECPHFIGEVEEVRAAGE